MSLVFLLLLFRSIAALDMDDFCAKGTVLESNKEYMCGTSKLIYDIIEMGPSDDQRLFVEGCDNVIGNKKDGIDLKNCPGGGNARRLNPQITADFADGTLWSFSPNGVVIPYTIHNSLNGNNAFTNAFNSAKEEFASKSRIKLVPRNGEADYVEIFAGGGCWSWIGNRAGGKQQISIGNGCEFSGTIIHEFLHALGISHTQIREDRDRYLIVHNNRIQAGKEGNFAIRGGNAWFDCGVYDYSSVMQYPGWGFQINAGQNTIDARAAFGRTAAENQQLMDVFPKPGLTDNDVKCLDYLYSKQSCEYVPPISEADWTVSSGAGKNWLIQAERWVSENNECSRSKTIQLNDVLSGNCMSAGKLIRVSGFAEGTAPNYGDKYRLKVEFKDTDGNVLSTKDTGTKTIGGSGIFNFDLEYVNDGRATQVTITEYGDDAEDTAGHFGTIVYAPKIQILEQCSFKPPNSLTAWTLDNINDNGWIINANSETWTGSYELNTREITIDVSDKFGGCIGNTISVTGMAVGTWPNYGDTYTLTVTFMREDNSVIETKETGSKTLTSNYQKFILSRSADGVKKIKIKETADDAEYWAGNWGGRLRLPVISDTQGSVAARTMDINRIDSIKSNAYQYKPEPINEKHFHLPKKNKNGGFIDTISRNLHNNDSNAITILLLALIVLIMAVCIFALSIFAYVKKSLKKPKYSYTNVSAVCSSSSDADDINV